MPVIPRFFSSFRQFVKLLSGQLIKSNCSRCAEPLLPEALVYLREIPVSEDRFDSKMSLCLRGVATRSVFLGKAQFVLQSVLFGSVLMVRGERHGEKLILKKLFSLWI